MDDLFKWRPGVWSGFIANGEHLYAVVDDNMGCTIERTDRVNSLKARDVSWHVKSDVDGPVLAEGTIAADWIPNTEQKRLIRSAKTAALSALKVLDDLKDTEKEPRHD